MDKVVTDYFSGALCVNLDHRKDKWAECKKEFIKHGLSVERFSAVDGSKFNYNGVIKRFFGDDKQDGIYDDNHKNAVMGCCLSHKKAICLAKQRGYDSVLILEDDVAFDEELNKKFNEWYKEVPPNWDLLYLGGNHGFRRGPKPPLCSPHLMKVTQTLTTHAYILKNTIYDLVLDRLNIIDYDVDVIIMKLQSRMNAYSFTPRLAWQRLSISDIWGGYIDYKFLEDNDGC